jgi:hypothetical protein
MKQVSGTCKKQSVTLPKIKLAIKSISLAAPKIAVLAKQEKSQ